MDRLIYDTEGNLLNEEELDLEAGQIIEDAMEFDVPASEGVEEEGHYEYKTYPNGGKERWWVVDVPGVPAVEAHKETRPIYRYISNPGPEDFVDPGPSQLDKIEAQVLYTALMTDTLLEAEEEAEENEKAMGDEEVGAEADIEANAEVDAEVEAEAKTE